MQLELKRIYGSDYIESPWFEYSFKVNNQVIQYKYCQPDGLLFIPSSNKLVVIEIKKTHCVDAYYQLFELYLPIVSKHYGSTFKYFGLEIVRWYDPDVRLPSTPMLCPDECRPFPDQLNVKIWKPESKK